MVQPSLVTVHLLVSSAWLAWRALAWKDVGARMWALAAAADACLSLLLLLLLTVVQGGCTAAILRQGVLAFVAAGASLVLTSLSALHSPAPQCAKGVTPQQVLRGGSTGAGESSSISSGDELDTAADGPAPAEPPHAVPSGARQLGLLHSLGGPMGAWDCMLGRPSDCVRAVLAACEAYSAGPQLSGASKPVSNGAGGEALPGCACQPGAAPAHATCPHQTSVDAAPVAAHGSRHGDGDAAGAGAAREGQAAHAHLQQQPHVGGTGTNTWPGAGGPTAALGWPLPGGTSPWSAYKSAYGSNAAAAAAVVAALRAAAVSGAPGVQAEMDPVEAWVSAEVAENGEDPCPDDAMDGDSGCAHAHGCELEGGADEPHWVALADEIDCSASTTCGPAPAPEELEGLVEHEGCERECGGAGVAAEEGEWGEAHGCCVDEEAIEAMLEAHAHAVEAGVLRVQRALNLMRGVAVQRAYDSPLEARRTVVRIGLPDMSGQGLGPEVLSRLQASLGEALPSHALVAACMAPSGAAVPLPLPAQLAQAYHSRAMLPALPEEQVCSVAAEQPELVALARPASCAAGEGQGQQHDSYMQGGALANPRPACGAPVIPPDTMCWEGAVAAAGEDQQLLGPECASMHPCMGRMPQALASDQTACQYGASAYHGQWPCDEAAGHLYAHADAYAGAPMSGEASRVSAPPPFELVDMPARYDDGEDEGLSQLFEAAPHAASEPWQRHDTGWNSGDESSSLDEEFKRKCAWE